LGQQANVVKTLLNGATGVFDPPKDAATVIDQGDRVARGSTAEEIAQPGVGLYPVGIVVTVAGNGTTTARVRLDGIATAAS
jgi:predicted RecA/RadA family phage recombinase